MSSIGVVVFRNSPLGRTQVLQECVNNSLNISNNENEVSGRQEIVIVRKRQKIQSPAIVPVTSLVHAAESGINASASAKRPRIRDEGSDDSSRTPTPLAVAKRNARERNRVRQVNDGFAALRRHIPEEVAAAFENANSNRGSAKKLSKVETLRMAVEYIKNLETLLNIGPAADKENNTHPSMESFPSPASSSPRDNSQEKSYFSLNSPTCDEDDFEEDDLDASMTQLSHHQYINVTSADHFHLVSTPHLYEEDEGQPLTPCSDLLGHDEVNSHILEGNFQFPNVSEQFTVIPDQSFCGENSDGTNTEEFEIKYADSLHAQVHVNFAEHELQLDSINPDLMINQQQYKLKTESDEFVKNQHFNEVELKKELPDIRVTPEDREQFEETLKWWQEKTRLGRSVISYDKTT